MKSFAVIMAGGSGERFWPVSRKDRPKQLLKLTHPDETLLEEAVNRIAPLISRESVYIATSLPLRKAVQEEGLVPENRVLAEPARRNTLGCLSWAAANLLSENEGNDGEIVMAVLTADHKIGQPDRFRETVQLAMDTAARTGGIVTIGIKPTRAETGYGYVELGSTVQTGSLTVYQVNRFREKPDTATAEHYVASGNYLWNSGMFFWTLRGFMKEMSHANPEVYQTILQIANGLAEGDQEAAIRSFESLPNESIDYALLEKASQVYTVAGDFPWDDVGAWDALQRSMPGDSQANVVQGQALMVDTTGAIVYNDTEDVLVTAIGLQDIVIAVTNGAVMVCHKNDAQRVKEILQRLPADSHLR